MREEVALQCAWLEGSKVGATMVGTLLGDQDSSVRSVAARSAGILGLDGLVSQLATLTKDPDPAVRLHALRAIDRVGVDASKYAVSMIEDADAKVSRAAQKIVGRAR
jgi:HEAT repeat protein